MMGAYVDKAREQALAHATVLRYLHYDQDTGVFTWKTNRIKGQEACCFAGTKSKTRYSVICIEQTLYKAHRLAWFYVHGVFPDGFIDHINGNITDNRICNLRVVNKSQNNQNRKVQVNNKSGVTGVYWNKRHKKWIAAIKINRSCKCLGRFDEKDAAIEARRAAEFELFPFSRLAYDEANKS